MPCNFANENATLKFNAPPHPPTQTKGQSRHHLFAHDIFKCIFMNEKFCISIHISLKFVPNGPIDNNTALF